MFRHVVCEETTDVINKGDKYYQAKTVNQEWYAISEKMFDKFQNYFVANNELLDED